MFLAFKFGDIIRIPFGWLLAATLFLAVYYRKGLEHNSVLA